MADRRRYTGTPRPQLVWTVLSLVLLAVVWAAAGGAGVVVAVAGWLVGLVLLGLRDRRHWQAVTEASGFERGSSVAEPDLRRVVGGRSVTVTTDLTFPAASHTILAAQIDGPDGVRVVATTETDGDYGARIADEAFNDRFTVRGEEAAVEVVLSDRVRKALLALDLPGTLTVTGDQVTFEVPFTGLTAAELERIADLVAGVAERVETAA